MVSKSQRERSNSRSQSRASSCSAWIPIQALQYVFAMLDLTLVFQSFNSLTRACSDRCQFYNDEMSRAGHCKVEMDIV